MAEKPIEIPVTLGGLAAVRKEIKQIKSDLINATDPKEIERLSARAGELTDKLRDANEQVNIFAGGSGFEKVSNNLGNISNKILSLDFAGANDSAKLLTKTLGSLSPQEIGAQIKGLVGVVGNMGKAFLQLGVQILTNPIFLLVGVVTAIIAAIGIFLNKIGLLDKVLDALFYPIQKLIDGFNYLTDAIGLTDHAGDEYASNETKRLDKLIAKNNELGETKTRNLDNEIRLQKAQGKDTEKLEREKQKQIIATAQVEFELLESKINNYAIVKRLSEEEIKDLKKSFKEAKINLQQAKVDLKVFNAEQQKEREDASKKEAEKRSDAAKKSREEELKIQKEKQEKAIQLEKDFRAQQRILNIQYRREVELFTAQDIADDEEMLQRRKMAGIEFDKLLAEKSGSAKAINDARVAEIQAQRDIELENLQLTEAERQVIIERSNQAIDASNEMYAQKELERKKQIASLSLDATKTGLQGISDLIGAFAGKSKSQQKKAFDAQKKLNIAITTIDTIKGGVSAFTGMVSSIPGPIGIALGVIAAAGVVASGIANIKKISSTQFDSGSTSGASGSAPANTGGGSTPAPAQPSFKLFGQENQGNQVSEAQNAQGTQSMTLKATVSETEITNTQKKISKFEQLASL